MPTPAQEILSPFDLSHQAVDLAFDIGEEKVSGLITARLKSVKVRKCPALSVKRNSLRAKLVKHAEDWRWGSLYRWVQSSEPLPRLLSPWPLAGPANWILRVNEPLDDKKLDGIRWSIRRGSPFGQSNWVESIARRLDLESTLRPR